MRQTQRAYNACWICWNALASRKKSDFDAAVLAVETAKKDPTLAEDVNASELDEIQTLLAKFPASAISN